MGSGWYETLAFWKSPRPVKLRAGGKSPSAPKSGFIENAPLPLQTGHRPVPYQPGALLGICAMSVEQRISLKKRVLPNHLQFIKQLVANSSPTTLREHLRKRRSELGLSQSQAAKQIGATLWRLSKWERGTVIPRRANRAKLVAWLGYEPENPTP